MAIEHQSIIIFNNVGSGHLQYPTLLASIKNFLLYRTFAAIISYLQFDLKIKNLIAVAKFL
jgi:hypothetical protein